MPLREIPEIDYKSVPVDKKKKLLEPDECIRLALLMLAREPFLYEGTTYTEFGKIRESLDFDKYTMTKCYLRCLSYNYPAFVATEHRFFARNRDIWANVKFKTLKLYFTTKDSDGNESDWFLYSGTNRFIDELERIVNNWKELPESELSIRERQEPTTTNSTMSCSLL